MASWIFFGLLAALALLAAVLSVKGSGLAGIGWLNYARLRDLRDRLSAADDPRERAALATVVRRCEALRAQWVLREQDLRLLENTRSLAEEIAAIYHPRSAIPLAEASIGNLLQAFRVLKNSLLSLAQRKGIQKATQFRLRHVLTLTRAWRKKEEWENSPAGRIFARYRMYSFLKWIYYLARCMDLSFWSMRMAAYFFHDVVFKIFLAHWYLLAGELALRVYRESGEKETELPPESVLEDFQSLEEPGPFSENDLPEEVRRIAETSRKKVLFEPWKLEWDQVRSAYARLAEDIARFHHPGPRPLYEARLFNLLTGLARFADLVSALETKPLLNKLLDVRVSHVLKAKETADWLLDNPLVEWARKYRFGQVAKYSSMLFKTFVRGHPGAVLKQFAFDLAAEGGKRWVCLYLHDKIAVEAHLIYRD
ncbi:MAG: hypothetical protein HZA02_01020 [Nitrospinae bacterium]|nr:hypothetical protein [Nitrospinota bacterium]